ncbi:MAG: Gfo/Idh/MocA family oxidoreductase [Bacillota bacterium]
MAVSVAVVGLGYWGPNLARTFARLPRANLRVLCDANPARLAGTARDYPGVQATPDYNQVIGDSSIDAVVLATPAGTHYDLALAALQAGKHVLVEKPLAKTVAQAEVLIRVAKMHQRVLMVGHVFLYNPGVRKVKELIDSGALGRIYYIYAQRLNLGIIRQDVNALWNFAPHDISVINYWLGYAPLSVTARGYAYVQPGVEDVVFLTMEYPGGIAANVHVSWLDPHKVRRMTVVGSEKMVEFDDLRTEARVVVYTKRAVMSASVPSLEGQRGSGIENGIATYAGDVVIPRLPVEEPLKVECREFVESILEGKTPVSDGEEGLRVVRVLEAAEKSLRTMAPVALRDPTQA